MRRTAALIAGLATALTIVGTAGAAEPEPPGTVLVSSVLGGAGEFSVSPGRIVYDGAAVTKRAISADSSTVTLGAPSTVGDGTLSRYDGAFGNSSGARTLWADRAGGVTSSRYIVKLTSGSSTKVLSYDGAPVRLSGNRALYFRLSDYHYVLYDLHSGRSTDVTEKYGTRTSSSTFTADLFGNYLVYTTRAFTIMRKNLSDGSAPVVVAPHHNDGYNGAYVRAYGDWVAWDRYVSTPDGYDNFDQCGLRNVRTMAPVVSTDCVADLTSAGAVRRTTNSAGDATTWSLQPYDTTAETTLPVPTSTDRLGIDGHVLAWSDADGLHAAPLADAPADQPRSLGDPVTSATYEFGGSGWPFRLVTTAPLTKCQVQITQGGKLVRQLDCNPGARSSGEVQVRWNGYDDQGHPATHGAYRWTAYAVNDHRSMLRSDGAAKQTTGTVTLTR